MSGEARKIMFECVEGGISITLSDIVYIESYKHKNSIHTITEEYHIYESMNSLQSRLSKAGFLRVHRGYIVNKAHVTKINNYIITMTGGIELPVSKANYKNIKDAIKNS